MRKLVTVKELEGCLSEIGANRTLIARDDYNKGFNAGMTEAMGFVRGYMRGEGLFQIGKEDPSDERAS